MRRGRKFKERRSIFSFGHIMLPLVGLLALGLLILGVRLLFFQSPEEFSMANYQSEEFVAEQEPLQEETKPPVRETARDETQQKPVVAVPVKITDEDDAETGETPAKEQETQATAVTVEKQANQERQTTSASSLPSKGFWGVQVGAFTVRESAEKLASEVRQKGHEAFVIPAEVGGKQYYRVRVKAGDNRKAAEQLEKTLASEGYPTLVAYQE